MCQLCTQCTTPPIYSDRDGRGKFLDDIIGAWSHGEQKFSEFIDILNNHHSSIKVKYELHPAQVNFLDTVFLEQLDPNLKKVSTKVYFKPTDSHALLHRSSYHPKHTFKGIIKSQIIRFYRISSKDSDLQDSIGTLFRSLRNRGYSRRFLGAIKSSTLAGLNSNTTNAGGALDDSGENLTQNQAQLWEPSRFMPLITTYSHPYLPLHHQFKTNFKEYTSGLIQFQNYRVISAHRRNKNLRDMLVRAKLPEERGRIGSVKSDHWAFKPRQFMYNPHAQAGAPILQRMTLNMKNIIYCISCEKCHRLCVAPCRFWAAKNRFLKFKVCRPLS